MLSDVSNCVCVVRWAAFTSLVGYVSERAIFETKFFWGSVLILTRDKIILKRLRVILQRKKFWSVLKNRSVKTGSLVIGTLQLENVYRDIIACYETDL